MNEDSQSKKKKKKPNFFFIVYLSCAAITRNSKWEKDMLGNETNYFSVKMTTNAADTAAAVAPALQFLNKQCMSTM